MRSHLAKVYLVAPLLIVAAILSLVILVAAFALHRSERQTKAKLKPVEHIVIAPDRGNWGRPYNPKAVWLI